MHKNLILGETIFGIARPYINNTLSKEKNIFLIGSDLKDEKSMRSKILNSLKNDQTKDVAVSFPEHLFEDQFLQRSLNLLSLENLLAESVDAIVLCVESPGSLTELGAFSNNSLLNNKLIVYLDQKYEKDNSFINLGPVKFLKNKTLSEINYRPFDKSFEGNDLSKLKKDINKLKKGQKDSSNHNLLNLFFSDKYLLALFYVIGKTTRKMIIEIIKHIVSLHGSKDKELIISTIDASLHTLLNSRKINRNGNYYLLSENGREQLYGEYPPQFIYSELDRLSLKMINLNSRSTGYTGYLESNLG